VDTLAQFVAVGDAIAKANIAQQERKSLIDRSEKGQPMVGVYVKTLRSLIRIHVRLASELGFTPASRASMRVPEKPGSTSPEEEEHWRQFDRHQELARGAKRTPEEQRAHDRSKRRVSRMLERLEKRQQEERKAAMATTNNVVELQTPPNALAKAEPEA
jgi:hypothetical protein